MFTVGLGLLLTAHWLRSLNDELRAARGDGGSASDQMRILLQTHVRLAAGLLLVGGATSLLLTWCQARWPRASEGYVGRRWRRRYRLAPPPAYSGQIEARAPLDWEFFYAWALAYAIVPTVLAFRLVPGLYGRAPGASATAPGRAVEIIYRGISVADYLLLASFLAAYAVVWWVRRNPLRRMESWLDRGVPVCLACGYPLRGLDSPACPECGAPWSQWYPSKDGQPVLPT